MSVSSLLNRIATAGNGVTTAFAFPEFITAKADIVVLLVTNSTGVAATKVLDADYTVALTTAVNGVYPSGATVNMVTPPTAGETLVIYRDVLPTQGTHWTDNDPMPSGTTETTHDRAAIVSQRLKDLATRSLRLADSFSAAFATTLPVLLPANCCLAVNPTGDGWVMGPTVSTIAGAVVAAAAAAASATAAAASQLAAAASQVAAAASATAAATSASGASTSAAAASASATAAGTSATAAATSATAAGVSATAASTSAAAASASETAAAGSATSASGSATAAGVSATAASGSATAAAGSATAASGSATAAAASALAASASETAAAASAAAAAAASGFNVTGTFAAPTLIAAGGTLAFTAGNLRSKLYIAGNAAPRTVGAFQTGTIDGQEMMVVGCDDVNVITIDSPTRCITKGTLVLAANDIALFNWDNGQAKWVEVSRNN